MPLAPCRTELKTDHVTDLHDIERLQAKSALEETAFRSHLPVIGPLIAWVRAAWNSVSTKWYVRPLIAQQSEFNALVAGQLRSIAEHINSQETRLSELDRRLGEQADRSAQQHAWTADRIGSHEGRLHDLSAWLIAQDREQSEAIHDLAEIRVQLGQMRKRLAQMPALMPRGDADDEERSE